MFSNLARFFKKEEASYSGIVERIGVVQESSGDAGRTCYALLLEGESRPRLLSTRPGSCLRQEEFEVYLELRVRVALTQPGDKVFVHTKGDYVDSFENETLSLRMLRRPPLKWDTKDLTGDLFGR